MSESSTDPTRNPLPPTDATAIEQIFQTLEKARSQWQKDAKQTPTPAPKIVTFARWGIVVAVVLFFAAFGLLALGLGGYAIAVLIASGLCALFEIFVLSWSLKRDFQVISSGSLSFEASKRHTLEINDLATTLSAYPLPALRLVRRSRNRDYEATNALIGFFAPSNFQTVVTQVVAVVALLTSVLTLVYGKDASFANFTAASAPFWILAFAGIGGLLFGTFLGLSALSNARPWVRKELVALEDAIVKLESPSPVP